MTATVLITGCSTGIGRATALAFARRGDRVYATMRAPERGRDLAKLIADEGLDAEILRLDVTDDASVRPAVDSVISREGRVDVVVNNAGVGPLAPIERTTDADWLTTFDTNLLGAVRVVRAALPTMRAQGAGTVVNISSIAGRVAPIPTQAAYAASKHALCAFTDSIVAECKAFGISAYCIEPGFFATSIIDQDKHTVTPLADDDPYKQLAEGIEGFLRASIAAAPPPDEVAELILAAADGTIPAGTHHAVGVAGAAPTPSAARGS